MCNNMKLWCFSYCPVLYFTTLTVNNVRIRFTGPDVSKINFLGKEREAYYLHVQYFLK